MSAAHEKSAPEAPAGRLIRSVRRRRIPESLSTTVHLDRRTRAWKIIDAFRADLVRHLGGKPSAVQLVLIEMAIQLRLRIFSMDTTFMERGDQSAHDTRTYLSWNNSLTRLLRQLGFRGTAERAPDLGAYLAGRAAASGAGQAAAVSAPDRTNGAAKPLAVPPSGPARAAG